MKNIKAILFSILVIAIIGGYIVYNQFFKTSDNQIPPPTTTDNQNSTNTTNPISTNTSYKDGQYTGDVVDAYYGNVQVKATVSGGKITDVQFLQYPDHAGHSQEVSSSSIPILQQEAISAQSANVDIVSGATQTSEAFIASLKSALAKAGA